MAGWQIQSVWFHLIFWWIWPQNKRRCPLILLMVLSCPLKSRHVCTFCLAWIIFIILSINSHITRRSSLPKQSPFKPLIKRVRFSRYQGSIFSQNSLHQFELWKALGRTPADRSVGLSLAAWSVVWSIGWLVVIVRWLFHCVLLSPQSPLCKTHTPSDAHQLIAQVG